MPMPIRLFTCLAMCASLLACAGPDDRGPSSPVAGTYRSGDLMLLLEPGGAMRLDDSGGWVRMRGLQYHDGDHVLVLGTHASTVGASIRCDHDGGARYRWTRGKAGLRLEPLVDACRPRSAMLGHRNWTSVH